jgi:hypothetical protein
MTTGMRVPLPGPEVVARAVAGAIRRPRRRIIVPWYYAPPALMAQLLPGFVDWLVGSSFFQRLYHSGDRRQATGDRSAAQPSSRRQAT